MCKMTVILNPNFYLWGVTARGQLFVFNSIIKDLNSNVLIAMKREWGRTYNSSPVSFKTKAER